MARLDPLLGRLRTIDEERIIERTIQEVAASGGGGGSSGGGAVDSVNGQTGVVVLDSDDVTQGSTNLYSQWAASNSGIRYAGHIAITEATVDTLGLITSITGTASMGFNNQVTLTDGSLTVSAATFNGLLANPTANNASNWIGQDGIVEIKTGNNKNFTGLVTGDAGAVYHLGTGTLTAANAVVGIVQNNSSGVMTNAEGFRALFIHAGTGTVATNYGVSAQVIQIAGTNTITQNEGIHIYNPLILAGTLGTNYGINIAGQTTGSTANYGIAVGAAGTNTLWVSADVNSTTAAGGITFGVSKNTNLYQSAADTLKTDDAFIAALGIQETAVKPRVVTVSDATSITPNNDTSDIVYQANTQAAGTLTINAPSGTAYDGQLLRIRIKSTNVQTFSFNAIYGGSLDTPLPVSTYAGSTYMHMIFEYVSAHTLWHLVSITDGY